MRLNRRLAGSRARWKILVGLAAVAAVVALPLAVWAGSQSNPGSTGVSRIEKTFGSHDWRCNIDGCPGYKVTVLTPNDVATVDVVVTVTLMYRLGRGEAARASFGYATGTPQMVPCCGGEPSTPFEPGSYRLASVDGRMTTTTLTWINRNLAAAGQGYRLYFHLSPNRFFAKDAFTKKATVVVETWAAGD